MNIPVSICPRCKSRLECATSTHDPSIQPQPGNVTICLDCHGLLQFDDALKLVLVNEKSLSPEYAHEIRRIRKAMRQVQFGP